MSGELMEKWLADANERIAELEAECKENGTALNRTLLTLKSAQAENERLDDHAKKWGIKAQELEAENERLRVVGISVMRDAERYRWLRDVGDSFSDSLTKRWIMDAPRVDAVIDAAMEGEL